MVPARSPRDEESAGARPTATPVRNAIAMVNHSTSEFTPACSMRGMSPARRTSASVVHIASAIPNAAPHPASSRLSVRNCRSSWPRVAPNAARIATSRRRASARVNSRLVTLTQAINSTHATAPDNITSMGFTRATVCSASVATLAPLPVTSPVVRLVW